MAANRGCSGYARRWGQTYEHGPTIDRAFIAILEEPLGWLLLGSRRGLCDGCDLGVTDALNLR
jgi:hypothetical protein